MASNKTSSLDPGVRNRGRNGRQSFRGPCHYSPARYNPTVTNRFWNWYYGKRDWLTYRIAVWADHCKRHQAHYLWFVVLMLLSSLFFSLGINYQQSKALKYRVEVENMTPQQEAEYLKEFARWKLGQKNKKPN